MLPVSPLSKGSASGCYPGCAAVRWSRWDIGHGNRRPIGKFPPCLRMWMLRHQSSWSFDSRWTKRRSRWIIRRHSSCYRTDREAISSSTICSGWSMEPAEAALRLWITLYRRIHVSRSLPTLRFLLSFPGVYFCSYARGEELLAKEGVNRYRPLL